MDFTPEQYAVLCAIANAALGAKKGAPAASGAASRPRGNGGAGGSTAGTMRFGRAKGTAFVDAEDRDLEWYAKALEDSIADPDKDRFRESNENDLRALRMAQASRAGGTAKPAHDPATGELPYDAPGAPGAGSFGGKDDEIPFVIAHDAPPRHLRRRARWEKW